MTLTTELKKKRTNRFLAGAILGILSLQLIVMVLFVDVQPIGPSGTEVGLATLNEAFHGLTGVNDGWYTITKCIGFISWLPVLIFAAVGLIQLIRRKSLLKVDREILSAGGLYIVTLVLYAFFEKVVINYRPVIMPGETLPEPSFPSSHTMLACILLGSTIMLLGKYISSRPISRILQILCWLLIVVMVIGRLLSGVHWFTDILGGVLISCALLSFFAGAKICEQAEAKTE